MSSEPTGVMGARCRGGEFMRCIRLVPLAAALLLAVGLLGSPASAADAAALTILEPYGAGAITDRFINLIEPGLEKSTGRAVKEVHAGDAALQQLAAAAPDGNTVAVIALLPSELADATSRTAVKLAQLTPIAKLTGPGSAALVVPDSSPIHNWAEFAAAARMHPLTIASPGRTSAAAVPIAFMERALGVQFKDVMAPDRRAILAALADKRADAGFLVSATLLPLPIIGAPPVRAIVTFGARRNRGLKDIPTFKEAIGPQPHSRRHNAVTSALALFGPPGMKPEIAEKAVINFSQAENEARRGGSLIARVIPLSVGNAALLGETMARDHRVIKELIGYLRN
jgi:tripartite-type tricarboxylate transporter receptor subunit TctC